MNKKVVLGLSGGIDSTVTAYQLKASGFELVPIYFANYSIADSGQLKSAQRCCSDLNLELSIVDFSFYSMLPIQKHLSEIPNNSMPNALFYLFSTLCLIACRIGANQVSLGLTSVDRKKFPKIEKSLQRMSCAINESTYQKNQSVGVLLNSIFPFVENNKLEILIAAQNLGVPLEFTYSCSQSSTQHCGICECCRERIKSFLDAGAKDETQYEYKIKN